MTKDELAELVLAKLGTLDNDALALVDAFWEQLAQAWQLGYVDHRDNWLAPNPYMDWPPPDPLEMLCECNHRRGDHDGPCVHDCACAGYREAKTAQLSK